MSGESRFDRLDRKISAIIERLPETPPDRGIYRFATRLEGASLTRLLAALGIWLFVLTISGFVLEFFVRQEERAALREEADFRKLAQVATAWEILRTRAGGDIGKGNALNTLIAAGFQLRGTDFSCKAIGIFENGACVSRPVFKDVSAGYGGFRTEDIIRLSERRDRNADVLSGVSFQQAEINGLRAAWLEFDERFSGVVGEGWKVRNARVAFDWNWPLLEDEPSAEEQFEGMWCQFCEFYDSTLPPKIIGSLEAPLLANVLVPVPLDFVDRVEDIPTTTGNASGIGFSFLDRPVMYVWSSYGNQPEFSLKAEDAIIWEKTNFLSMCANQEDALWLVRYLSDDSKTATLTADERDGLALDWAHLSDPAAFNSTFTFALDDVSVDEDYWCFVKRGVAEPLLRQRLTTWYERLQSNLQSEQPELSLTEFLDSRPKITVD